MVRNSLLIASVVASALPFTASAQEPAKEGGLTLPPVKFGALPPEADEPEDKDEEPEIVVQGQRPPQRGAVVGDIAPEVQFSRASIRALGVSSISEVLDELAPQIRSDRGRGETPVILVNGHRTTGFSEVRDMPPEAISRIDVLPEEVALKYGFSANQHVVNIVLRKRFRAFVTELRDSMPTEGGRNVFEPGFSFTRIGPDSRVNLSARYTRADALTEDQRDIAMPVPGKPYALGGNITAAPGAASAEIDPALSLLAGYPITIAGVPATAASGAPHLADFVPTANHPERTDTRPFRSLLPSTEQLALNAVVSQTIFTKVEATVNARLQLGRSDAESGLAGVPLVIPAGNPFSPFANSVGLYRYASPADVIRHHGNDLAGHLGLNFNTTTGGWNWSLSGAYDRTQAHTRKTTGLDTTDLQAAILADDPRTNPFTSFASLPVSARAPDIARSDTDQGKVDMTVHGPLGMLPAGPLAVTARFGGEWEALDSVSVRSGNTLEARLSRQDLSGQFNLDIPIASRRRNALGFLGNLSLNANFAAHRLSDAGTLKTYGFGLTWSPVPTVKVVASMSDEDGAPSLMQLGAPVSIVTGVRAYDFQTGTTVDASQVDGGNPALKNDNRRVLKIGATVRPSPTGGLSLTAVFVHKRIYDAIATPIINDAVIAAAFPDHFVRDAAGALVRIERKPVNLDRETLDELRWGVNFSKGPSARGQLLSGGPQTRSTPARMQFALYHTWRMHDAVQVRPGLPAINLLDGGAIEPGGGLSRHEVEAQAGLARNGIGVRASTNWRSARRIDGSTPASSLHFADLATMNLRFFINFGQQQSWLAQHPWLRGLRLTMSVDNLFDGKPRVIDGTGQTPRSYQRDLLDPLGRTFRISLRKVFY